MTGVARIGIKESAGIAASARARPRTISPYPGLSNQIEIQSYYFVIGSNFLAQIELNRIQIESNVVFIYLSNLVRFNLDKIL
jgi:hypothetical protein